MKFVLVSNKILENLNRTITKSNRTLVEEYSERELKDRSFIIQDAADEAIANITYPEIADLIDKVGGRRSTIDKSSPCFVDRYGEVISVNDAVGTGGRAMHRDYAVKMVKELYKKLGFMETELDKQCIEDWWVDTEFLSDQLQSKMMEYGIFRINAGTNAVENRFYCVLPSRTDYKLNGSQYDTLENFLWLGEELEQNRIIVFLGDDFHFFDDSPDEILEEIKSYYDGHAIVDSLNEDMDSEWREIENAIGNITYQQADEVMKELRGYVNDFNGGSPYFIDRYGDIISVDEAVTSAGEGDDDIIHMDYAGLLFDTLFAHRYYEWEEASEEYTTDIQDYMMDKMMSLGIIRVNTGTSDVEERCYCALPDKKDFVLNDSQYDALDKFFWWAKENKGDVQVYMGDAPTLYYAFDKEINTPDKLINRVKQYYNGFSVNEADQLSIDVDNAVASQVQKDIEEKERQLESAMYEIYKDSLVGYNGAEVTVTPDDKAKIVTMWDGKNAHDWNEDDHGEFIQDVVKLFREFGFVETEDPKADKNKKTVEFNINFGYSGNLNKKEVEDRYFEILKERSKCDSWCGRGFILPDGTLTDNGDFGYASENCPYPHWRVDQRVISQLAVEYKTNEEEIWKLFGVDGRGRTLVADKIGCIRVNGSNEDYIALPQERPTNAQFYSLADWIDGFFEMSEYQDRLSVTSYTGHQQVEYFPNEYDGEGVVNKIKQFYNSGTLREEKQDCKIKRKILKGRK